MIGTMRWLAPRNIAGFLIRFTALILVVAVSGGVFDVLVDGGLQRRLPYYLGHALFVGGPLILFFLTVTLFQIRLQRELWQLSRKDGLTGLNNRRTFLDLATLARSKKKKGVLLMLDADRFKEINDTHGHQVGDACLKSIAYTLRRNIRQSDVIGRIGGEEFAIYLHDTSKKQARAIGERLTMPIPFRADAVDHLTVTLSVGAAVSQAEYSLDDIFAQADRALYEAKLTGRARLVFWDEGVEPARPSITA